MGTGANRSLMTAGMAVHVAGERVVEKAKRLAAHLMEVAPIDLEYEPGQYRVTGTDRTIGFWEVAHMPIAAPIIPTKVLIWVWTRRCVLT